MKSKNPAEFGLNHLMACKVEFFSSLWLATGRWLGGFTWLELQQICL